MINIALFTDSHLENPNPGDVLIGLGIRALFKEYFNNLNTFCNFYHVNIFEHNKLEYDFILENADIIVICGTPQLGINEVPDRFSDKRFKILKEAKNKGIKVLNLWIGIVDQNNNRTLEKSLSIISAKHKDFINRNFNVFDLVIARDKLTESVLTSLGVENHCLLDSVFHAAQYLRKPVRKTYNLITIKDTGATNDIYIRAVLRAYNQLSKELPTYILVHTIDNYNVFKNTFNNLLVCNDPPSLVELYSGANKVLTHRIHGAIPAYYCGCKVCGISIDSRKYILENAEIPFISQHSFIYEDPKIIFKQADNKLYNRLKDDKKFLFERFNKVFNNGVAL